MGTGLRRIWLVAKVTALSAAVVAAGGSAAWMAHSGQQATAAPAAEPPKAERISRLDADRIAVPAGVADRLRLKTAAVVPAEPSSFPPFQGVLALDNNTLQRPHTRFAGEVVELGSVTVSRSAYQFSEVTHPVQVGDAVTAGQLLAVVWSKDLGEKKSQLVDAVSRLKADEKVLANLRDLYKQNATAERSVRDAERSVESDRVAVDVAERTLKSWRLSEEEVAAVRAETDRLANPPVRAEAAAAFAGAAGGPLGWAAKRPDPTDWARVEVRAARDGTVLEKNVSVGDIVDTTADLFKLGDLSRLTVWVHVYEDDLPLLTALPKPVRWAVSVPARPGVAFPGMLEQVGAVIDPNQHTALVSGRVDNPTGELKIGQAVTVSVSRPAHPGELAVPADAVVEDGRRSVVFIRPDPAKAEYVCQPVTVARRTREAIILAPEGGLNPGDRVVTSGALLLHEAVDALPASPATGGENSR